MMNTDPDAFTAEQRQFLAMLVSDFHGPTSTGTVLRILEQVMYELKSDFAIDGQSIRDDDLRADVEVCLAALQYMKVKDAAEQPKG